MNKDELLGCIVSDVVMYDGDPTDITLNCPSGKKYTLFNGEDGMVCFEVE